MSVRITGVTRAFMAQITRHRHASFTCSSQHYQDYSDYEAPGLDRPFGDWQDAVHGIVSNSLEAYSLMLKGGMPKDRARMVLTEAMGVNMIMTANVREWAHIINLRMCRRNTDEMIEFATAMWHECKEWFPELFYCVGPDCDETKCRQGAMACNASV